jgi:DNA polymerase-3 subunit gamma/tau
MDFSEHASLAVRHRPRRFVDVVGQRHVKVPLQRAVADSAVPKQTLFSGGSGLGKTTIARILAAAVLCETSSDARESGDSCTTCATCRDIHAGTHPDVVEIDAASNGRVDEIREIAARAHLAPLRGRFRVYIIDEAHGLSQAGGQAFLKLLEEPPAHVLFMLATTDPERMLHTNRSRCVQFELLPPTPEEIAAHVRDVAEREQVSITDTTALELVQASPVELGLRGVLMTLEKVLPVLRASGAVRIDVADVLGRPSTADVDRLTTALATADLAGVFTALETLQVRHPLAQVLEQVARRLEQLLVDAVLQRAPAASIRSKVAASDLVLAARRDGSRLAALVAFTKIAALADPDLTATAVKPASEASESESDASIPEAWVAEPDPSDMVPPSIAAEQEYPAEPIPAEPAPPPTAVLPVIDDTGYVVDPFTETTTPPPPMSGATDSNAAEAHTTLLAAVAAMESRRSRIAAAALRPAVPSFRDGVLWLALPAGTLRALEADAALIAAAAERSGLQVQLETPVK